MHAFHYDSVDSTNEEAKRLIRDGKFAQTGYVLAREQTRGKGQHGKNWVSPKDAGIYLTVVEKLEDRLVLPTTDFTLAAGVACVEVLHEATGLDVRLKPVNDLVVDGRKLGGILTETMIEGGLVTVLITGVGINVRLAECTVVPGALPATCLEELVSPESLQRLDQTALIEQLADHMHAWNEMVLAGNTERVREAWQRHATSGAALPVPT